MQRWLQTIKSIRETPAHSPEQMIHNKSHRERISTRPLRDNRLYIDYSVLNDGYDIETSSPKRRRRHSSRPQSEPTVPRQAAQKKIEETKIHLSSQYDNLDLEKIMDSQYPALQLVLLSGVTNAMIDRTKSSGEEYIIPVLGTLTVHGVTESKPDPDNIDLENMAPIENVPENIKLDNEPQSTPSLSIEAAKPATQDNIHPPTSSESLLPNTGNGVTNSLVQTSTPAIPQTNNDSSAELHGITNTVPVEPDHDVAQQITAQTSDSHEDVLLKGATNSPKPKDNTIELNGVMNNSTMQLTEELKMRNMDVNGVTENVTQTTHSEVNDADHIKAETLPDLVLTNNVTLNEANTTEDEDEDEAAEALLQLSKSDTIPDEDPELPLGVLPVDAAPLPITLGNQDVLNAIENFKQTNGETGVTPNNSDNKKVPDDP